MIYLDRNDKRPLYEQLYNEIKKDITSGRLPEGTPLSSLRVMEQELHVSRNTVDRAYQQLLAEGYIRSAHGAGYFVENIENDYVKTAQPERQTKVISQGQKPRYDFEYSSINSDLFPWKKWKKYVNDAIEAAANASSLSYETNKGHEGLRRSLCDFLNRHRGVRCKPEQIVICAGTQFAMDIVSTLLPWEKYRLAFEEPGYSAMRHLFQGKGYQIDYVPVLENGIDVEKLYKTDSNLLYITPSHQFPTGVVTTIATRHKLLKWAIQNDAYIIENDYDSEFRYGTFPIPSLQSLDDCGRVIYTGTLSKILSPTIRCAYVVIPYTLIEMYDDKYKYFNSALPSYHQRALYHFIEDGFLEKQMRKVSIINEKKYRILVKAIEDYLADYVELFQQPAGVHTLVKCIGCCGNQNAIIQALRHASIGVYGIRAHYHDQSNAKEDILLMGFNSMPEDEIRRGCQKMAQVFAKICKDETGLGK